MKVEMVQIFSQLNKLHLLLNTTLSSSNTSKLTSLLQLEIYLSSTNDAEISTIKLLSQLAISPLYLEK